MIQATVRLTSLRQGYGSPPKRQPDLIALAAVLLAVFTLACGKKGPPLPPLVRLPVPPGDFVAERRGSQVELRFAVPAANTDGSRPANVERVDVYAFTGPAAVTDDQLLKLGTRVASVAVKAPRDPDATVEPDEPDSDIEPPEGPGLDQGAIATVIDDLTEVAMTPVDPSRGSQSAATARAMPLAGSPASAPSRIYVGVGINTRGRHGPLSRRVPVPLVKPLPAPSSPTVSYDETSITVVWNRVADTLPVQAPATGDVLPARVIGIASPVVSYHVYEAVPRPVASPAGRASETAVAPRLTTTPVTDPRFVDSRIEWGAARCYRVRAVETIGALTLEGDASLPACVTLADTFAPAPPKGLRTVPSEGAISLSWDANEEKDFAGYLVLRGSAGGSLAPLNPAPIPDTTFTDAVPAGSHFVYAVRAVDKAGNASAPSAPVEETAR